MPLVKSPNKETIKRSIHRNGWLGVNDVVSHVANAHRGVVRSWKEARDKPVFATNIQQTGNSITGTVLMKGEDAEKAHVTVWTLLNWGTKIRFMGVSDDWQSKTDVGKLSSGPGGGHTTGLDLKDPQPGIVARDWIGTVNKQIKPRADILVFSAFEKGFRNSVGR